MGTREGRALQGMSMGGHGALKLAFKYPELFSSVVAFAGGYIDEKQIVERHPDVVQQMFGGDASKFVDNMPIIRAAVLPMKDCTIHETWNVHGMRGTGRLLRSIGAEIPARRAIAQGHGTGGERHESRGRQSHSP